jgi:hypothetical protein
MTTTSFKQRRFSKRVYSILFIIGLATTMFGTLPVNAQKTGVMSDRKGVEVPPDTVLRPAYSGLKITPPNIAPAKTTNVAGGTTYTITFDPGDPIGGLGAGAVLSTQYQAATGASFLPNAFGGCNGNPSPNQCWSINTSMTIMTTFPELVGTPGPGVPSSTGNGLRSSNDWTIIERGDPSILMTLDTPASTVSATFAAITQAQLATAMFAYGEDGNLIQEVRQVDIATGGNQQRLTISSATPIKYVAFAPGSVMDFVLIDDIAFTTVGGAPPQAVNEQVSFTTTTQSVTGITGTCATQGYTNQYNLNVDLRNIGPNMLNSPFFQVLELQEAGAVKPVNQYRLRTADDFNATDCTGGLVGTTQAIPGPIAPGQVIPVNFQIAMPQLRRFRFFVGVYAVVGGGLPPRSTARRLGKLAVEATDFDPAGNPVLTATFIPEKGMPTLNVTGVKATLAR